MPSFRASGGIDINYEVHQSQTPHAWKGQEEDITNVVLIMGFGATLGCWAPQLEQLLAARRDSLTRVLLMDNRGVGGSSSPKDKQQYQTHLMAADILGILDAELGWRSFHVVGHSMGSMIGFKLAVAAATRVASLTLISATAGHWQSVPLGIRPLWYALQAEWREVQGLRASTPEARAMVDLRFHFSATTLAERRPGGDGRTRQQLLQEEYVEGSRGGGMEQPNYGFQGQLHAVWSHSVSDGEVHCLRRAGFPMLVIHGRHDILAHPAYGERLAARLGAPCMMLEGAHMICRENGAHINLLLDHVIYHGARLQRDRHLYLDNARSSGGTSADSAGYIPAQPAQADNEGHSRPAQLLSCSQSGPYRPKMPNQDASADSTTPLTAQSPFAGAA